MLDDPPILKVLKPIRRPTEKQILAFAGAITSNGRTVWTEEGLCIIL